MDSKISLVLIGGLISLISALSVIILQHILAMKKLVVETRQHPFQVVYNKQIEFFDALALIFFDLNCYITTIDVWLGETSIDAPAKVEYAAKNNQALTKFDDLLQRYYMYLPEKLLKEANQLHSECMFLSMHPDTDKTYKCINLLFSFQNSIREFVGVEKLSEDFLKAFASNRSSRSKAPGS